MLGRSLLGRLPLNGDPRAGFWAFRLRYVYKCRVMSTYVYECRAKKKKLGDAFLLRSERFLAISERYQENELRAFHSVSGGRGRLFQHGTRVRMLRLRMDGFHRAHSPLQRSCSPVQRACRAFVQIGWCPSGSGENVGSSRVKSGQVGLSRAKAGEFFFRTNFCDFDVGSSPSLSGYGKLLLDNCITRSPEL